MFSGLIKLIFVNQPIEYPLIMILFIFVNCRFSDVKLDKTVD